LKHRVFIAINLPAEVIAEIDKLQLKLDKLRLPIAWELPHKTHLTLNFMGKLEDQDIDKVRRALKQVVTNYPSLQLQPFMFDTLYIRHEPSLIYLLVKDEEGRLGELQKELTTQLDSITPQPGQKFLPHITIGRVKKSDPTFVKQTLDKISAVEIDPLSVFTVEKIDVMESFVSQVGSSFQRLGSISLGKRDEALAEVS